MCFTHLFVWVDAMNVGHIIAYCNFFNLMGAERFSSQMIVFIGHDFDHVTSILF